MAKKDGDLHLDAERREEDSCSPSEKQSAATAPEKKQDKTEVKNAHATGLGSMGRNDQKPEADNEDLNNY